MFRRFDTNTWTLMPSSESETIETQTDYGFGTLSEEKPKAGYAGSFIADGASNNIFGDASGIITEGKYRPGDTVTTLLAPSNNTNNSSITIGTAENSTTKNKPYALFKYKDELPVIEDFTVEPDENNPYYPRFKWNSTADDTWYGFILIDKTVPKHQYHNSFCYRLWF